MEKISFEKFLELEMRVGEIREVYDFPNAIKPAYQVKVYFGEEIGLRQSSVQITHYDKEELMGKQVICVMNFPPKQIANFFSEVLVLGVNNKYGKVVLLTSDQEAELGTRVY